MESNYAILILVVLVALAIIVLLARKNLKDKKKFEQDVINSELKPEKHDDDTKL